MRKKYSGFFVYGASMGNVLRVGDPGICEAFTLDWARRILNGKASYAVSKHRKSPFDPNAILPEAEQQRLLKKATNRGMSDLNAQLNNTRKREQNESKFLQWSLSKFGNKYGALYCYPIGKPVDILRGQSGADVVSAAFKVCRSDMYPSSVAVLNFEGRWIRTSMLSSRSNGHAIGLDFGSPADHFFDSNIGEFSFPKSASRDFEQYWDEIWDIIYRDNEGKHKFIRWELIGISDKDPY